MKLVFNKIVPHLKGDNTNYTLVNYRVSIGMR